MTASGPELREDGKPAAYDLTGQETGRPTGYHPDHCQRVIELGSEGKSKTEIAFELDVARQTLDVWAKLYHEFNDALTRAKQAEQVWWERKGRDNLEKQVFQASMWSRSMAARFPDDWRETSRQEQTGPGGGPIQIDRIQRVIVDPNNSDA